MFNHNNTEWAPQVTCKRHANFGSGLDLRRHKDVNKKQTRKTDAHVQARTLTSEIDFSIQVLDLRSQTQLEQVQTATQRRKEVSINMSEDVQKKRWASHRNAYKHQRLADTSNNSRILLLVLFLVTQSTNSEQPICMKYMKSTVCAFAKGWKYYF